VGDAHGNDEGEICPKFKVDQFRVLSQHPLGERCDRMGCWEKKHHELDQVCAQ
jgi:hypothetical protein